MIYEKIYLETKLIDSMNRITYTTRAYNATGVQINSTFAGIRPTVFDHHYSRFFNMRIRDFLRLNDFNNFE